MQNGKVWIMNDYQTQRIITEMYAKGIKQSEIAEVLNINQSSVSRLLKKTADNKDRKACIETYTRSIQLLDELVAINHPKDFIQPELDSIRKLRCSFLNGIRNFYLSSGEKMTDSDLFRGEKIIEDVIEKYG